jgi:predicted nucleic acid-binding protein
MPDVDLFVDTNILVHALDRDAGVRHEKAKELVAGLWRADSWPAVSVQVLQELFVNLCRRGAAPADARDCVRDFSRWHVVENTVPLMEDGIIEMERWRISFWDGLILAAARRSGAAELLTEDLSHGQDYGGIHAVNPFMEAGGAS